MALPLHVCIQEEARCSKFLKTLIYCAGGHTSRSVHLPGVTGACMGKVLQGGMGMYSAAAGTVRV